MSTRKLKLTAMGHGGAAIGRDKKNRVIFVQGGIPGELVEIEVAQDKKRFGAAVLRRVLEPSPHRVPERVSGGLGPHGGLLYQHIDYSAQLTYKREVVIDQLKRIGGLTPTVKPTIPSAALWEYDMDVTLSPTERGGFGFWSPVEKGVVPAGSCPTLVRPLQALMSDFDLELPELRRLTLRGGEEGDVLVALEINDVEPPDLVVDFPVSVAIVLPDRTAANLIGDNYIIRKVKGRPFQISAGCSFYSNQSGLEALVDTVMKYAVPAPTQTVLELYSGVGTLTAFLAERAREVHGLEINEDAINDAAHNLEATDNVSLYEGWVEENLPMLPVDPDIIVADPPGEGMSEGMPEVLAELRPKRIVTVYSDVAIMARDGKALAKSGYRLREVQPIDMLPQTFHIHTVGVWQR